MHFWRSGLGWPYRLEVMKREWRGGDGRQLCPCWDFERQHTPVGESHRTAYLLETSLSNVQTKSLQKDIMGNHSLYESVVSFMWEIYCPYRCYWLFVSYVQILWPIKTIHIPLSFCGIFSPTKRKAMNCLEEDQFFLPNDLLKSAVLLLLKVDHWIGVS